MAEMLSRILKWVARLSPEDRAALRKELEKMGDGGKAERDGLYRRGRIWWVSYQWKGRRVQESTGSTDKAFARDYLAHRKREAERSLLDLPRKSKMTFGELVHAYLSSPRARAKRSASQDVSWSRQVLAGIGRDTLITAINRPLVEKYQGDRLAEGKTPATVNRHVAFLRAALNHAVQMGEIPENPIRGVQMLREAPARRPVLTMEDEERLLAACRPPWLASLVRILLATGCRLSEVLDARFGDVDFDRAVLVIRDSKAGTSREVPLPGAILEELRSRRGLPKAPIVAGEKGQPVSRYSVASLWQKSIERAMRDHPGANLRGLRIHDLRHVFATRCVKAGMTVFELSKVLGHKDGSHITRRYPDVDEARIRSIVESLPVSQAIPTNAPPPPARPIPFETR